MPKVRTIQIEVYNYDELSEEAQAKVVQRFADINVDYDWWEGEYDYFKEELEKIGVRCKTFWFELGYDRQVLFMEEPLVKNEKLFAKFCDVKLRSNETLIQISTRHLGGGDAYNFVTVSSLEEEDEKLSGAMTTCLKHKLHEFWHTLQKCYEDLTSIQSIEETIRINEYVFTKSGSQTVHLSDIK